MQKRIQAFTNRLTLTERFTLVSLVVLVVGMVGIGAWVSNEIEAGVVNRTGATNALFVNSFVAPHLQSLSEGGSLSREEKWELSQLLRDTSFGQQIVAFKVWDLTGLVLYSTDEVTTGQRFELDDELQRAAHGYVSSELSNLDEPENAPQRAISPRLQETYSPVRLSGTNQIIAVAEFYQRVEGLEREMAVARQRSWLVVGGAMLLIYVLLVYFVSTVDRTIRRQQYALNDQVNRLTELLAQNRELDERVRRAAARTTAINERFLRRISAELHDGPIQELALALLRMDDVLASAEQCASPDCGLHHTDHLAVVKRSLEHSLKETRALAAGMGVPELDPLSPADILRRVVRAHEQKTSSKVTLNAGRLPDKAVLPVKITLYRLVQEALRNAYQHAGGIGQQVNVRAEAGWLEIEIADGGPGFDSSLRNGDTEHLGLIGMRERVESLGGRFRIESQPGNGTRVIAWLPLQVAGSLVGT
jgi:signal transduction histidine kinase